MRHLEAPQGCCRLGVARCDITPPVGIYHRMWGAATHERATGVHRPLTATAVAFHSQGEPASPRTEQVIVAVDHCLLGAREMEALLLSVSTQSGLARDSLLIAFSHTHAAGLMDLRRADRPGGDLIAPYLAELARRIAGIVHEARQSVQPAVLMYATGRCMLAGHRDFWDDVRGHFVCGLNPEGPADDTVLVIRATGADGRTLATIVNYACHPTTLAWQNTLISPDYPGAMREVVEGATQAPCIFLQGASGDLGPRDGFVGDPAVADRNGRQLGYAVLAALEGMQLPLTRFAYQGPVVSGATLGTWAHEPLSEQAHASKAVWRLRRWVVDLPYRADLPTVEQARAERERWRQEEQAALDAGDAARARDCHALVERQDRWLTRLDTLPPGKTFPLPVALWQIGDGFWLAVEGEHYQLLQSALRAACRDLPLVVATIVNGSRPTYLVPRETYGRGIYQESIAVLAPGSLEQLIAAIGEQLAAWRDTLPRALVWVE
jgi:hypothetical protein